MTTIHTNAIPGILFIRRRMLNGLFQLTDSSGRVVHSDNDGLACANHGKNHGYEIRDPQCCLFKNLSEQQEFNDPTEVDYLRPGAGTDARLAIQCVDPITGKTGDFLFIGDSHRIAGTRASPVFDDMHALFTWAANHGWDSIRNTGITKL